MLRLHQVILFERSAFADEQRVRSHGSRIIADQRYWNARHVLDRRGARNARQDPRALERVDVLLKRTRYLQRCGIERCGVCCSHDASESPRGRPGEPDATEGKTPGRRGAARTGNSSSKNYYYCSLAELLCCGYT